LAETRERVVKELRPLLEHSRIVVMQGYVGATRDGFTTTLGSESSDLSAALVGASLGAKEIRIWKTVPGIFTADPELVPHAKLLRILSFEESEEIGRRGARVLFQTAAEPLVDTEANIIMRIASTKTAAKRSTVIQKTLPATRLRAAKPLTLVLDPQLFPLRVQQLKTDSSEASKKQPSHEDRRLVEHFKRTLDRATYSWTSERDRLVLVRRELRDEIKSALNAETHSMHEEPGVSTVSLVIRMEDGADLGSLSRQMLKSLRQFNVLSYFTVEHSLVAAVDQSQGVAALKKLHRDFFGS
jgi:aspartate kinase